MSLLSLDETEPPPQHLKKPISGFQKKCAEDGQRNRQTDPNSEDPSNKPDFKNSNTRCLAAEKAWLEIEIIFVALVERQPSGSAP